MRVASHDGCPSGVIPADFGVALWATPFFVEISMAALDICGELAAIYLYVIMHVDRVSQPLMAECGKRVEAYGARTGSRHKLRPSGVDPRNRYARETNRLRFGVWFALVCCK